MAAEERVRAMNNGKSHQLNNSPLNDAAFWALLRAEPTRTLEVLQRHLGAKRAINSEMEHLCWRILLDHCDLTVLAGTLLQRLDPQDGAKLLDLDDADRRNLFERIVTAARVRLSELKIETEDLALLAEIAFEARGELMEAAALYALAHDEKAAASQDGRSRLERLALRCKLLHVFYLEKGSMAEATPRHFDLVRSVTAEIEALSRSGDVPAEGIESLRSQLRVWLGRADAGEPRGEPEGD
jgi:hypothetical protein